MYLASQCGAGSLHPELYRSGSVALELGVQAGPQMTPECAVVKMMLCLGAQRTPAVYPPLSPHVHRRRSRARSLRLCGLQLQCQGAVSTFSGLTPCPFPLRRPATAHPDIPLGQPIAGEL